MMPTTRRSVLCGSLGAAAAVGLRPGRAKAAPEPIRFGWPAAITGANSAVGIAYNRAINFAANKINAAGGVNGRMIEVVTRETQGDPAKAVNAVVEMISNLKVHAVFGPANSGEALAAQPILARSRIPTLTCGTVDTLIDPAKYPTAYRITPNNVQWDAVNLKYCLEILKAKKAAVIGDNTGFGTMLSDNAAANLQKAGADVVYHVQIDADAQDVTPHLLRSRSAGAEVVVVWSNATGLLARLMNTRGRMGWDVPFSGMPAMGAGDIGRLLEKPQYWEKVYIVSCRSCSYDASGKLPPRTQKFLDELTGKIELTDTLLYWVMVAYDAVNLVADAVAKTGSTDSAAITGYWSHLKAWPGTYCDYTFTPEEHNGFPTDQQVMAVANTQRQGAFNLAPGYSS